MTKTLNQLDHNAAAIKRWRTRLKRAMTMLDKLERQRRRIEKATFRLAKEKGESYPIAMTLSRLPDVTVVEVVKDPPVAEIDTSIPAFLARKKLDPVAQQIEQEQQDTKRKKSAGRIAKMKAKQSGATRKMPLTGKAALEAIRNG